PNGRRPVRPAAAPCSRQAERSRPSRFAVAALSLVAAGCLVVDGSARRRPGSEVSLASSPARRASASTYRPHTIGYQAPYQINEPAGEMLHAETNDLRPARRVSQFRDDLGTDTRRDILQATARTPPGERGPASLQPCHLWITMTGDGATRLPP